MLGSRELDRVYSYKFMKEDVCVSEARRFVVVVAQMDVVAREDLGPVVWRSSG